MHHPWSPWLLDMDVGTNALQAMAALQQQQQLQRQMLLQQQLLLQQQAMAAAAQLNAAKTVATGTTASTADRKSREIYVGNLAIGVVTTDMLRELFNTVMASQIPDAASSPCVMEVKMDASGTLRSVPTALCRAWHLIYGKHMTTTQHLRPCLETWPRPSSPTAPTFLIQHQPIGPSV